MTSRPGPGHPRAGSDGRENRFPVGRALTIDELRTEPYGALAGLRSTEPVSWIPALDAWLVTSRALAVQVMHDATRFTVDDPRFSTATVIGPSMLSLDGPEHLRHRRPFAGPFRPTVVRDDAEAWITERANELVASLVGAGRAELRSALAAPLAVDTITRFLGLDVDQDRLLGWYREIVAAVEEVTAGRAVPRAGAAAVAELAGVVTDTVEQADGEGLLHRIRRDAELDLDDIRSATLVMLFGAIETSEGMTANALWHLLGDPARLERVRGDRSLTAPAIEESLRLEPAAAAIDRYTTVDVVLGEAAIPSGELVRVSLLAANRDPEEFDDPDRFDLDRPNVDHHLSFVHGPHACLGLHLARLETAAAIAAVLTQCAGVTLDRAESVGPQGLIFRKPGAVVARWDR